MTREKQEALSIRTKHKKAVQGLPQPDVRGGALDTDHASLDELVAAYVIELPEGARKRLLALLVDAQRNPPEDKKAFVSKVNLLLDVYSLRILTGVGDRGRLSVQPNGSLRVTRTDRGGSGGFKKTSLDLVSVPRVRVGNRYTARRNCPQP